MSTIIGRTKTDVTGVSGVKLRVIGAERDINYVSRLDGENCGLASLPLLTSTRRFIAASTAVTAASRTEICAVTEKTRHE